MANSHLDDEKDFKGGYCNLFIAYGGEQVSMSGMDMDYNHDRISNQKINPYFQILCSEIGV